MIVKLTNYRCFPGPKAITIDLGYSFIAFVGSNNSGKSTLLRFLYEFRPIIGRIYGFDGGFHHALKNSHTLETIVPDKDELFSNVNEDDIVIEFSFIDTKYKSNVNGIIANRIVLHVPRYKNRWSAVLYNNNSELIILPNAQFDRVNGECIVNQLNASINLSPIINGIKPFVNTMYIGAFRNTINIGAK